MNPERDRHASIYLNPFPTTETDGLSRFVSTQKEPSIPFSLQDTGSNNHPLLSFVLSSSCFFLLLLQQSSFIVLLAICDNGSKEQKKKPCVVRAAPDTSDGKS